MRKILISMSVICTSLTVPAQPSPRFHVEAWLPFRNFEVDYCYSISLLLLASLLLLLSLLLLSLSSSLLLLLLLSLLLLLLLLYVLLLFI